MERYHWNAAILCRDTEVYQRIAVTHPGDMELYQRMAATHPGDTELYRRVVVVRGTGIEARQETITAGADIPPS